MPERHRFGRNRCESALWRTALGEKTLRTRLEMTRLPWATNLQRVLACVSSRVRVLAGASRKAGVRFTCGARATDRQGLRVGTARGFDHLCYWLEAAPCSVSSVDILPRVAAPCAPCSVTRDTVITRPPAWPVPASGCNW